MLYSLLSVTTKAFKSKRVRLLSFSAVLLVGVFSLLLPASVSHIASADTHNEQTVVVIDFDKDVGPISSRYLQRELENAEKTGASLVIITLDTPGGLLSSTREIVTALLDSNVPTAAFVHPNGAQAASAGTFIGAAANFLVMSPVSNIGAASPVGGGGEDLGDTLQSKVEEDAAALIRSIAERRNRNVEELEKTVFEATSYSATEAVEKGIADLIAEDVTSLIELLDGMQVELGGETTTLSLQNPQLSEKNYGFFDNILAFIGNPNLAFILISLGTLAITIEIFSLGTWIPGITGVILLAVGFGGAGQLPLNWVGVVLLALSIVLFIVETQVAGFGFFGIAGVVALVFGGLFLFNFSGSFGDGAFSGVAWWVLAVVGVLFMAIVVWLMWELRNSKKYDAYNSDNSKEHLIGKEGVVTSDKLGATGQVHVSGEFWSAKLVDHTQTALRGARVVVQRVDALTLIVEKI